MTASTLYLVLAGGMLLISFFLLARMRLISMLRLFSWQSTLLAIYAAVAANVSGEVHLYITAILTFVLKAVFIPWMFLRAAKRSNASQRLSSYVRPTPAMFLGAVMILFAFLATTSLLHTSGNTLTITAISVAMLLLGLLMLIMRREMYGQMIGFLMMENGIFTFGLVLTGGMPLLVELGIFFDVMIGATLMAALSYRVQCEHESVATDQLSELVD